MGDPLRRPPPRRVLVARLTLDDVREKCYRRPVGKNTSVANSETLHVHVDADLKERLVFDAIARGSSINDVAVAILADHFTVKFEGTGRKSPGAEVGAGGPLLLRVPPALWRKVDAAAGRAPKGGRSKVAVVQAILRAHYAAAAAAA